MSSIKYSDKIAILLLLIISYTFASPVSAIIIYNSEQKTSDMGYIVAMFKASEIPAILGSRADSLTAKIYDGSRWITLELYLWNGSSQAYFSGTTIDLPRAGRVITDNVKIIVKIPTGIKNIYTREWPTSVALKHIHHRLLIEYTTDKVRGSFYLFYDKEYSSYLFRLVNSKAYNHLQALATKELRILNINHEYMRSFIVDPLTYKIIAYNLTYEEYLRQYTIDIGEPPWYIDGGGGGGGGSNVPPPPRPEEFFHIHIGNFTLNESNNEVEYNVYVGACIYDINLYIDVSNLDNIVSEFNVTVEKIRKEGDNYTLIDTKYLVLQIDPSEDMLFEIPFSDLAIVSYRETEYYNYTIRLTLISGELRVNTMYMGVIKDLTGREDDGPTPETKTVKHGWESYTDDHSSGFTKAEGETLSREVVLFTTPVINGFYKPVDNSLDEEYGIQISFTYDYIDSPVELVFKLNGESIYSCTIEPEEDPWMQFRNIWIPISTIKDIVSTATYNGLGLILSVESSVFEDEDALIRFLYASVALPIHPELWKPKSIRFVGDSYAMFTSSIYVYDELSSILSGVGTLLFAGEDYCKAYTNGGTQPYDDYGARLDLLVSGIKYWNEYMAKEYYVSGIEITMLFSKNYFKENYFPGRPGEQISLNGEGSEEDKLTEALDELKWIYDIYQIIMIIRGFGSWAGSSAEERNYASKNWGVNFMFFIIGKWEEILRNMNAELSVTKFETDRYVGYNVSWVSNGEFIEEGRFRLGLLLKRNVNVDSDGEVIIVVKIYTDSNDAQTGSGILSIKIPIKHGTATEPTEPKTLAGKRLYR